jgi:hypothetical protein
VETTRRGEVPAYLGADITDRYARRPRPVDVCGLTPLPPSRGEGGGRRPLRGRSFLIARFWTWTWDGDGLGPVLDELSAARASMLDGPAALAAEGRSMRACERLCRAPGRTADGRGRLKGPYAGFIRTSLELFAAIDAAGLQLGGAGGEGVGETFPGLVWSLLARGMAGKGTALGLRQRAAALRACGVALPRVHLTHDQLDAAAAALVAAAARRAVPGIEIVLLGEPLRRRATGELEEGFVASVRVDAALALRVARALGSSRPPDAGSVAAQPRSW